MTGELNAALIKVGTLISANGTTWIDMENGTFSFGKDSIKYDGNALVCNGTFKTGEAGQRVEVSEGDYKVLDGASRKGYFGFRSVDYDNYLIPRFSMGHTATSGTNDYFAINPYKGNGENPQNYTDAYVDIAYKSAKLNDWSNLKMYSDGVMRLAPLQKLEITTNYINGQYSGSGENTIAEFGSSSSEFYDRYLDVRCIRNTYTSTGLILAHRSSNGTSSCFVRVNCDSNGERFFRPLTSDANVELGSASYPWKKVTAVASFMSEGIVYNHVSPLSRKEDSNKSTLDKIKIVENVASRFSLEENSSDDILLDVTEILDTSLVEVSDDGIAYINQIAFTKLLLKESKRLKTENEVLIEKNNELMARLEVTQQALDELLLNIMEV